MSFRGTLRKYNVFYLVVTVNKLALCLTRIVRSFSFSFLYQNIRNQLMLASFLYCFLTTSAMFRTYSCLCSGIIPGRAWGIICRVLKIEPELTLSRKEPCLQYYFPALIFYYCSFNNTKK